MALAAHVPRDTLQPQQHLKQNIRQDLEQIPPGFRMHCALWIRANGGDPKAIQIGQVLRPVVWEIIR